MSRTIFRAIADESSTVAVIQTASSGNWGQPVLLSTVRVANDDLEALNASRINRNPKVETIESWKVDATHTGPRSKFGKTLNAMLEELPKHVHGQVAYDTGCIDEQAIPDFLEEFKPVVNEVVKAVSLKEQLERNTAPAPARYATDDGPWTPTAADTERLERSLAGVAEGEPVIYDQAPVRSRGMRL